MPILLKIRMYCTFSSRQHFGVRPVTDETRLPVACFDEIALVKALLCAYVTCCMQYLHPLCHSNLVPSSTFIHCPTLALGLSIKNTLACNTLLEMYYVKSETTTSETAHYPFGIPLTPVAEHLVLVHEVHREAGPSEGSQSSTELQKHTASSLPLVIISHEVLQLQVNGQGGLH